MALKCVHEFLEAVFLRVALDSLLDDEDVWSPPLSNGSQEFVEAVFIGAVEESLLGDEEV